MPIVQDPLEKALITCRHPLKSKFFFHPLAIEVAHVKASRRIPGQCFKRRGKRLNVVDMTQESAKTVDHQFRYGTSVGRHNR